MQAGGTTEGNGFEEVVTGLREQSLWLRITISSGVY